MNSLSLAVSMFWHRLSYLASNSDTTNLCAGANSGSGTSINCSSNASASSLLTGHVKSITDTLLYVAGAVAVIIIIISGFRYISSQGSSDQVKQAKDTLLYAIIGLAVVILAYAIVQFVGSKV